MGFFIGTVEKVLSKKERVRMVKNRRFPKGLSLKKVCKLLKVSRSTVYYKAKGERRKPKAYGRDRRDICS